MIPVPGPTANPNPIEQAARDHGLKVVDQFDILRRALVLHVSNTPEVETPDGQVWSGPFALGFEAQRAADEEDTWAADVISVDVITEDGQYEHLAAYKTDADGIWEHWTPAWLSEMADGLEDQLNTAGLPAAPAAQPDDREFIALPEHWRDRIDQLESDEYDHATAAGYPPTERVRDAYNAGLSAATELIDSWVAPVSQPDDEAVIERMAQAIYEANGSYWPPRYEAQKDAYRAKARAALAALRGKQQ